MFVSKWALNGRHPSTSLCQEGGGCKCRRLASEEAYAGVLMALIAYVRLLALVSSFKYLVRFLLESYNNWEEVIRNLRG